MVNNTDFGRQDSLNEDDRLLLTLHVLHSLCLCRYLSSMVSSKICTLLPRVTPFSKCFTHYFDEDRTKISIENNLNMFKLNNYDQIYGTQLIYPYSNKRIIFHSVNTGPELTSDEISINSCGYDNYLMKLTRYDFIRQPPPYDTQCQEYGNGTRYDCLNNCYHDQYMKVAGCIPTEQSLYTFRLLNKTEYKRINFCRNFTEIENTNIIRMCESQCQTSCIDTIFIPFEEKTIGITDIIINFNDQDNYKINYEPNMNIFRLFISAVNLVSSFYGTTIIDILRIFKNLITNLLTISTIIIPQNKKLFGLIKVIF